MEPSILPFPNLNFVFPKELKAPTDEEWESLLHPDRLSKAQEEAKKRRDALDEDEIRELQVLAKTDTFFLAYSVLGYTKLTTKFHGHFCSWLDKTRTERKVDEEGEEIDELVWLYRMTLLARSHFKSTIKTITGSVQAALPDVADKELHPFNLGTDIRLLLGHEAHAGSQRFLYEITGHFTGNPKLIALFPECVPNPRVQRINKSELELPRSSFWAEPTFDTIGVGGRSQGRHYDLIKLDDIFGDKARDSRVERATLIDWFDNIQSFLVNLKTDHIDVVGTRWSVDDIYAHMMEVYGSKLVRYIRRVEEFNKETGKAEPVFPEHFPAESLDILRKNKRVWAAQYANDPHEGLAEFDVTWKRFYSRTLAYAVTALTPHGSLRWRLKDLDILVMNDPAVSKTPGIVVTGTDKFMNIFLLETIKREMSPMEFVETQFSLVQKYWPRAVCMEEVLFSEVYSHWLRREMLIRNIRFNVLPYKPPKDKVKFERVSVLGNYYAAGQIFFHADQKEMIWEFDNFGATDNYHLHDALAQGEQFWRPAVLVKEEKEKKECLDERFEELDPATGYSVM